MKKLIARASAGALSMLASAAAFAGTNGPNSNVFADFANTVVGWAKGPLGTGLAVTMMLVGAGMGVARNSPMPALSGVAGAAFLNWGPGIIQGLTGQGALI